MTPWWQHVLFVGAGVLAGVALIWLGKRRPQWRVVIGLCVATACGLIAVDIGLGHFSRMDAVWPALVALNIGNYGFGRRRAAEFVSAELEPGLITFSRDMPPLTDAEAEELKAKWKAVYGKRGPAGPAGPARPAAR